MKCHLTPKGPSYVFWQHRNIRHVCVIKDFQFLAQISIDGVNEEYLSCALNFRTLEI